jgi:inhibitor of KinA
VSENTARIEALGDSALLVTLGDGIDVALNRRAHRIAASVEGLRARDGRFGRAVAAYASVLVPFDPIELGPGEAREAVAELVAAAGTDPPVDPEEPSARAVVEIEVRYGGDDGPDLDEVAALHDLRPADVVELHTAASYRAFFLGFAPGFAYLGPLPASLVTPRLATPRERVPAGSVAIALEQTAVYPFEMPGGWRLIGRTEARLWDLDRPSPTLILPGDQVRFVPVR